MNMNELKHKIKRVFLKLYINSYKKNYKNDYNLKSEYEHIAIEICRKAIKREGVSMLMCPITYKRYIKNVSIENYIIIRENQIDIINHHYFYNIPICNKTHKTITLMFDGHVGEMRDKMEQDIRSNIKYSLENIQKNI